MDELRPPIRYSALPASREPYWNIWRVLAVVAVIVLVPIVLAVSCLAAGSKALQESTAEMKREQAQQLRNAQADAQQMVRDAQALVQPKLPPRRLVTVTERVPGRTVKECSDSTGGIINEAWQKCRQGYTVTRQELQ